MQPESGTAYGKWMIIIAYNFIGVIIKFKVVYKL